jgi:hypothetical protein
MKRNLALSLHCEFTPEELQAKAQELAQATIELHDEEEEKATVSKEYRERIKELRARQNAIAKTVKVRGEMRLVECIVRMNQPEMLQKTTIRLDTGEVVKTKPMTEEERQQELFEERLEEQAVVDEALARMLAKTEEAPRGRETGGAGDE